jgi:hypothetical protein
MCPYWLGGIRVSVSPGQVLEGVHSKEPVQAETITPGGPGRLIMGIVVLYSEQFQRIHLTDTDITSLVIRQAAASYKGNPGRLRLGLQAYIQVIAYVFDPYFRLSVSRVDPLPHQLEAVYEQLLKTPRVRFLLADDAGAGKTIMAGLSKVQEGNLGLCESGQAEGEKEKQERIISEE